MKMKHQVDTTDTSPKTAGVVSVSVSGQFDYDRAAPADWVARLEDLSPPSDERGFLRLVFEPGDPWAPVQRWELYEMIHPSVVHPEELAELRGAHPRSEGHPCTATPISSWAVRPAPGYKPCLCRRKLERWRGSASVVSLTEWNLFRRTGYVGRPFWVIQGTTGGHKVAFTHEEGLLLEAEGYPSEAPPAGALPFAPFDGRVIRQISRFNRLWQFKNNLEEYREAMGPAYEKHRREVDREMRRQLIDHLTTQMQDVNELFLRAANKGELDGQPRTDIDYDRLDQLNDESFIETGHMLHHSRI